MCPAKPDIAIIIMARYRSPGKNRPSEGYKWIQNQSYTEGDLYVGRASEAEPLARTLRSGHPRLALYPDQWSSDTCGRMPKLTVLYLPAYFLFLELYLFTPS